jgi:release factor glutamine methyltransferase
MTWPTGAPSEAEIVIALRTAGCVFAEDEAALLIDHAATSVELEHLVARRISGEPLEVILGWAEFAGLRILIEPGVFVPRRRSELLVTEAISLAADRASVVDLCCGSGALGAAVKAAMPGIRLYAADLDPAAVRCARRNLGTAGDVFEGDLYRALPRLLYGRVDILIVNAPYVPSDSIAMMPPEARVHEPIGALDGGPDGLDVQRRVAREARDWLSPGGHILIETSDRQASATAALLAGNGLATTTTHSSELGSTVVRGTLSP